MLENKENFKKLGLDEIKLIEKDKLAIGFLANISNNLTTISRNKNLTEKEKLKLLSFSVL